MCTESSYLYPVHHHHNGQARAHFDLPWNRSDTGRGADTGRATAAELMAAFPAFQEVWGQAQEGVVRSGEILLLPANWLHHVITEPWLPDDGSSTASRDGGVASSHAIMYNRDSF
jgi:hypothetical protein